MQLYIEKNALLLYNRMYCYISKLERSVILKIMLKLFWRFFRKLDKQLFICVLACSALSVVILYSIVENDVATNVSSSLYKTQLIAAVMGAGCAMFLSLIDYNKLAKLWFLYAPISLAMVLLTFTGLGIQREGADDKAWLNLFGITTIQPSEILKIAFILTFAYHIYKTQDKLNSPLNICFLLLHGGIPIILISMQGDQGTALIFAAIFITMLFVGGISLKYIISALLITPIGAILAWNFLLQPHHKKRIQILFNPAMDPLGVGNQQRQGKIALGSGQLYGKGLFGGDYSYVSEVQNDFIFSYVGQTLGFVGCVVLCAVLCYICLRLISNSSMAKDKLGKLICVGVFALIFTHSVMNIGMVLGVMPVIGVPLPFVSGGGTAMLSMYVAIGLAFSVYAHSGKNAGIFYTS